MSSGGLTRSGASLNGDDGTTASRGFPASFAPAARAGGAAVSWAVCPAVASAGPALAKRSTCAGGSGGGAGSSGPPSVSAATAARTCSSIESENAGRSTRAGGRSLLLPRTRRGNPADRPGRPVAARPAGLSGYSSGRLARSGRRCFRARLLRRRRGRRHPVPGPVHVVRRVPGRRDAAVFAHAQTPWRRERDAFNCATAEHTARYISSYITESHELTTNRHQHPVCN